MNSTWTNWRVLVSPNELFTRGVEGRVIADDGHAIAVKLSEAESLYNGKVCSHLVASVRHENRKLHEVMDGESVLCALTLVPDEKFDPRKPCDVSWWRGGGAVVGDVRATTADP